eukprot:329756-Chlamydomonas_euryale.AAC.1
MVWSGVGGCGRVCARCGRVWSGVVRCGRVWSGVCQVCQVWPGEARLKVGLGESTVGLRRGWG